MQHDIDSRRQRVESARADVEQATEVERLYPETQQITQHSGSGRRQAMPPAAENNRQQATPQATTAATTTVGRGQRMASQAAVTQHAAAAAPGYYGPQPG